MDYSFAFSRGRFSTGHIHEQPTNLPVTNFSLYVFAFRTEPIRNELSKAFNGTQTANVVQSVLSPILLFVGIIGNSLSLAMMRRRNLRGLTTCFYLACLSVADLFCVLFGLFPVFLLTVTSGSINARWWLDCKLMDFFTYASTDISIWIVVFMTIDRYIATCHPVFSIKVCNKRVAKLIVGTVSFIMVALNAHLIIFYTFGIEEHSVIEQQDCIPTKQSSHFFHTIWPWLDFSIYSLLPDTLIFTFNVVIIRSIIIKRKRAMNNTTGTFRRQTFKMTRILLVISTVTLLCTMPITVIQLAEEYDDDEYEGSFSWNLAFAVGNLLMFTNHSINFVLFCLTGSRFRRELLLMLGMRNNIIPTRTLISRQNGAISETVQ